jgi:hypothetical protein
MGVVVKVSTHAPGIPDSVKVDGSFFPVNK